MKIYLYLLLINYALPLSFLNEYNRIKNPQFKIYDFNFKNYQGMDMRFYNINDTEVLTLYRIRENIEKKLLLEKLQRDSISLDIKMALIENNDLFEKNLSPNISKGGLMDDYNFEIK